MRESPSHKFPVKGKEVQFKVQLPCSLKPQFASSLLRGNFVHHLTAENWEACPIKYILHRIWLGLMANHKPKP